jgi:hypothetical protein
MRVDGSKRFPYFFRIFRPTSRWSISWPQRNVTDVSKGDPFRFSINCGYGVTTAPHSGGISGIAVSVSETNDTILRISSSVK